jgi:hypothetical protein
MHQFFHSGVCIEGIERWPGQINGAPTGAAVFSGDTERGNVKPKHVTSDKGDLRDFGACSAVIKDMLYAVNGSCENGGGHPAHGAASFTVEIARESAVAADLTLARLLRRSRRTKRQ